jgi:hypothetical protein
MDAPWVHDFEGMQWVFDGQLYLIDLTHKV